MNILAIYVSVVAVSLISIIAAIPLLIRKHLSKQLLRVLLSLSVGTLLGGVFIHFIPEMNHDGYHLESALFVLGGFFLFFILEKLVHHHHTPTLQEGHSHAYHLAPINLIGDAVHNLIDGLVIAGAYLVDLHLGIAATLSVIFHEIPQEIADFAILLYAGLSKKKALIFNFLSAASAIVGATLGIILSGLSESFTHLIIPFTAGGFIYIAAANLTPELHREHSLTQTILQLLAAATGIAIMVAIAVVHGGH